MFHLTWMPNTSPLHMLGLKAAALLIHYSKRKCYLLVLRFLSAHGKSQEKNPCSQETGRNETVLRFLMIWRATCSRTFYFSIIQFHCCDIYAVHSHDSRLKTKYRLGVLWRTISKATGHWLLVWPVSCTAWVLFAVRQWETPSLFALI